MNAGGLELLVLASVGYSLEPLAISSTNLPGSVALVANGVIVVSSILLTLLWWNNRDDRSTLWLALSGFAWLARYIVAAYDGGWPRPGSTNGVLYFCANHIAVGMALAFCAEFLRLPATRTIVRAVFAMTGLGVAATLLSWNAWPVMVLSTLAPALQLMAITWLIGWAWRQRPELEHGLILGAALLILPMVVHDTGRYDSLHWWDGLGFQMQPFAALTLFMACLLALGRRYLGALADARTANVRLERAVLESRNSLAISEAARRELEVQRALEGERERLMREMHDGIGSNLVTALAIAKQADESPRTIATLKRAISDLKITVDSLAPVEGDVVALLANFRHRAGPDLAEAGLECKWQVENCPPLEWLNAENALHMLRIIQEAIGNVLTHSRAKTLTIGCAPENLDARSGVLISIADDGRGYDEEASRSTGRGIENMRARATTLGGLFMCTSNKGSGTRVTLWLPEAR